MPKYRKKRILVTMEIAEKDQFIVTLEGITEAKAGDCIVTGVDNEQWAIKPEWFNLAYTHVSGNTYQRKPQVLTAHQIDEVEEIDTPNGPIRGDKGDYKVTGTKGEKWYVKPDIFDKTYEEVRKNMHYELIGSMLNKGHIGAPTNLQNAIDQVGYDAVAKSLAINGVAMGFCDVHGHYALPKGSVEHANGDYPDVGCQLCPPNLANGTSATDMELYIDLDPSHNLGTNPQQKVSHIAEDVRGNHHIIPPTVPINENHKEIIIPPHKD